MKKRRAEQGFTRWILTLVEENSPVGELAKRVRDDEDWMSFNRSFGCFVDYMKKRKATKEELRTLAQAWERYCGQQTPYLDIDYFDNIAQETYELNRTVVSIADNSSPKTKTSQVYIYALVYYEDGGNRVRYIGQTENPLRRLRQHVGCGNNLKVVKILLRSGFCPLMIILDIVPREIATQREKAFAWYFHYIKKEGIGNQKIEFEA